MESFALREDARPYSIVVGADGNLRCTLTGANAIAKLSPEGAIREFPIPSSKGGTGIITATENGAWFTEPNADRIAFIDHKGAITEHRLADNCMPFGIAVDNEQAVWFTCMNSNHP